jgi:ABC-type transport system involved in cytochrome bd biosynthesis fused ATPase/permease subunit
MGKSSRVAGTKSPDIAEGPPFTLQDISLSFRRNELVAVIGTVGSGKSSLLSALAGEMRQTGGIVTMGAARAFCPQSAWIQNATVRDNILFGKEMDHKWYD